MAPADRLRSMIVAAVDFAIREVFPTKYFSLCHAYAIVGSLVAGVALGREYRPVAGIAVIDCGSGHFLRFTDTTAFTSEIGGAYHCWMESYPIDAPDKELVDMAFLHNSAYAKAHGLVWEKEEATYLWGRHADLVIEGELASLPGAFPEGKVWFREIAAGADWLRMHMHERQAEYVRLAGFALKKLHQDHAEHYPPVGTANS